MNVAVLTLTRDRLEYSQHCFASLRQNAGCDYEHFVLDQASTDGTQRWLMNGVYAGLSLERENIGISRGHNKLLDMTRAVGTYDAYVTFDNDCEVTMPGTLAACAKIAASGQWVVSPTVLGLNYPPQPGPEVVFDGERIGPYRELGGIFRAMPGSFARTFRFTESNPLWGWDERDVGRACAEQGIGSGYLLDWHVNHLDTTRGQELKYPAYFERKFAEMR